MRERPIERGGYTRLGTSVSRLVQIPFGLTDRQTGVVWYLFAAPVAPVQHIVPNSPDWEGKDRLGLSTVSPGATVLAPYVFAAFEEPYLRDTQERIFVRNGRLGYDDGAKDGAAYGGPRVTAPHLTLWFVTRYELVEPANFTFGQALAFETAVDW